MNELISIVVPVYNSENSIKNCLHSLCNQTYKNIEIVVVNDGSKDNSLSIIEEFKNIDTRIILINQENQGLSCARNNGLKSAHGKYIYFCDSDDYLDTNTLNNLIEFAEKNELELVEGYAVYKYKSDVKPIANLKETKLIYKNNEEIIKFYLSLFKKKNAWNKLIKRSFLIDNEIYFEPGQISEDILWLYKKILPRLNSFGYLKEGCYYYVKTGENTITRRHSRKHYESYMQILSELLENEQFCKNVELYNFDIFSFLAMSIIKEYCYLDSDYAKEYERIKILCNKKQLLYIGNLKRRIILFLFLHLPKNFSIKLFKFLGKKR